MRMPRPRITVRALMIAVATAAVVAGLWRRSVTYAELADEYQRRAVFWLDTKKIDDDIARSERYLRVARYPWLPAEPDPAMPE